MTSGQLEVMTQSPVRRCPDSGLDKQCTVQATIRTMATTLLKVRVVGGVLQNKSELFNVPQLNFNVVTIFKHRGKRIFLILRPS